MSCCRFHRQRASLQYEFSCESLFSLCLRISCYRQNKEKVVLPYETSCVESEKSSEKMHSRTGYKRKAFLQNEIEGVVGIRFSRPSSSNRLDT